MSLLMHTLHVDLGDRSYPVYIGRDLLADQNLLAQHVPGSQVVIVSNDTVAPLYLDRVRSALADKSLITEVILPDGEQYKTLDTLGEIFDQVMADRHNRSTTFVAVGGGVVGDMTGFAAASYQRGVDFVQVPTTLLAQVDSSVGGKTAVNHPSGKNMIGAFHQPVAVLADMGLLGTLPAREYAAGVAEVVKYGVISEAEFFSWLEENAEPLIAQSPEALSHAVAVSCQAKAAVVADDERESGRRAILNFGHTFGHAIERCQGYGEWLHGEAVANSRRPPDPAGTGPYEALQRPEDCVLCGDFNICPAAIDSWDEESLAGRIFHTGEERERFQALLDLGLTDTFRHLHPEVDVGTTVDGGAEREERATLVEGKDLRALRRVLKKLTRQERQERRFAGARRPEHQRVPDVADVEVQKEARTATRPNLGKRRTSLRKEG